ncbi:MAG: DUF484 family protein [Gammaproteobacteria bacterium]|nr:DUF484 family protein [Gammaproteobacteria bacterium]
MPEKAQENTKRNTANDKPVKAPPLSISADDVNAWLAAHPDFFMTRDHLVADMQLPHHNGEAVSLVERQVAILRERNINARKQIDLLLEAARHNTTIFDNCRRLVLSLIEAKSADACFNALEHSFRKDFHCSAYHLLLFGEEPGQINHFTSVLPLETVRPQVGSLLDAKEPLLGVLREELQDFLFRHNSAKVSSAAIVSIKNTRGDKLGLLSIGSGEPRYFESGMGTLFLGFIAEAIGGILPQFVPVQTNAP